MLTAVARLPPFALAFGLALLSGDAFAADLHVTVVDESGQPTPFRAWVDIGGNRLFEPSAPQTVTPYSRDRSFSADGEFSFTSLPEGEAVVHIEKGKEYVAVDRTVRLSDATPPEVRIALRRWIDMPSEGWYSADFHIHLGYDDPRILTQLALADDLHLSPAFTYWLRGTEPSWAADWPMSRDQLVRQIAPNHILTYSNIEIERINSRAQPGGSIGASFLYNLTLPVTAERFTEHFPTDADLILEARRHSPGVIVDTDKPSWAETVVGAALGAYDTVQICHNHYHRLQTLAGGWGMIGPVAVGESNAQVGDALFHRTNELYYRLLNCGFRLSVSGGTAIGVMAAPNGYNRTYAQLDGPLTAESYWQAVKAGRTFATSGPMLQMTVNGQPLGSTIAAAPGDALTAKLRLRSIEAIEAVELVQDGRVVQSIDVRGRKPEPSLDLDFEMSVTARRSGFVAARALFRAPDGLLRQAHTSPVYVSVDGKPAASAEDARYMMSWIDELTAVANQPGRYASNEDRDAVLATYRRARDEYERILQTAQQTWGDR